VEGKRVKLYNGTIKDCEDGVILDGEGHHQLSKLTVTSTQNQIGDRGIRIRSDHNELEDNLVSGFSGEGFRIGGNENVLTDNTARDNGNHGFRITGGKNRLSDNLSEGNGGSLDAADARAAEGFTIEGDENELVNNTAFRNAGRGVRLEAGKNNLIKENTARISGLFDVVDESPDCENNEWSKNSFGTRNQDCIE
jgi:parallel beta-helix repeat protein